MVTNGWAIRGGRKSVNNSLSIYNIQQTLTLVFVAQREASNVFRYVQMGV